jgi:hypothetical protein
VTTLGLGPPTEEEHRRRMEVDRALRLGEEAREELEQRVAALEKRLAMLEQQGAAKDGP